MLALKDEWGRILRAGEAYGVDPLFLAAIRQAEAGRPGREFGVLVGAANTYETQVKYTANTITHYLFDYVGNPTNRIIAAGHHRIIYNSRFIEYTARRYAPIGAGNDPTSLNANWLKNVTFHYNRYTRRGWDLQGDWPFDDVGEAHKES